MNKLMKLKWDHMAAENGGPRKQSRLSGKQEDSLTC